MKIDLGFGCMRLPVTDATDNTSFDYEKAERLVDRYMEAGYNYFDTAYVYHSYEGEKAVKKIVTDRYPRESFELVTKLPLRDFKDEEDMEKIFNEQLENCGVTYFDYYLLHNMGTNVYSKCCKYDAFGFIAEKKSQGKALKIGMSFHDTPRLLEEILEKYGEILDFLQLQVNYIDWEQPNVKARECLEIAEKYGKEVIVMEPCKGGMLIELPEKAKNEMKELNPDRSIASWAFRFAATQKGVVRVLTGMNEMSQLEDNLKTFKEMKPLDEKEMAVIEHVRAVIDEKNAIPCTACSYCTEGCPKNIPIPQYFSLYNSSADSKSGFTSQIVYYNNLALNSAKAGECIGCGQCEKACPQHLEIIKYLDIVAEKFERNAVMPTRKNKDK